MTVFAAITMSGIQLLGEQPMNYRNKMIVGIALAIGIGIEAVPDILQFCPQLAKNILEAPDGILPDRVPAEYHCAGGQLPGQLNDGRIEESKKRALQERFYCFLPSGVHLVLSTPVPQQTEQSACRGTSVSDMCTPGCTGSKSLFSAALFFLYSFWLFVYNPAVRPRRWLPPGWVFWCRKLLRR